MSPFFRSCACVTVAITLAACASEPAGRLTEPAGEPASRNAGRALSHVTGSGHTNIGLTDDLREFTFHAIEHPDGSVTGSYKVERTDTGQYFLVDVTCLSVVGNSGWVAGRIVETNIATVRVGTVSYFFADDNGEGGDTPDVISIARINDRDGSDVEFCTTHPRRLPTLVIAEGNVQVR
jgi:hypothetical protein